MVFHSLLHRAWEASSLSRWLTFFSSETKIHRPIKTKITNDFVLYIWEVILRKNGAGSE